MQLECVSGSLVSCVIKTEIFLNAFWISISNYWRLISNAHGHVFVLVGNGFWWHYWVNDVMGNIKRISSDFLILHFSGIYGSAEYSLRKSYGILYEDLKFSETASTELERR
jgi:hypothetical protein